MGLLAGSTVMLLTVIWGSCVIVGRCDIREIDGVAMEGQNERGFHLTGTLTNLSLKTSLVLVLVPIFGLDTLQGLWPLSVLPFLVVQLSQFLNSTSGRHLAVLVALIISLLGLILYCFYQVFQPWIQKRKLLLVKHKHLMSGLLRLLRKRAFGKLLNDDGEPNPDIIQKLFNAIDENGDGFLSASELNTLIIGIRFDGIEFDMDDAVAKVMRDFDKLRDNRIDLDEFRNGITKWLHEAREAGSSSGGSGSITSFKILNDFHLQTKREHALLGSEEQTEEQSEEASGGHKSTRWMTIKAVLLLLLGTIIAAAFADPLVDAVDSFADATSIPTFFISFIALPLATNSSEAVSSIIFASRKKVKTASLAFSELYGAATMNNLLCLSVLLALVYLRGLTWDFSSEVLVIFVVCIVMGGFASFRTTFPLWTSILAFLLYPFSLALVYILDYVFD